MEYGTPMDVPWYTYVLVLCADMGPWGALLSYMLWWHVAQIDELWRDDEFQR